MDKRALGTEDKKSDIRLITLKRWNPLTTDSIWTMGTEGDDSTSISYQNHHIIQIEKIENQKAGFLSTAYGRLKEIRREQRNPKINIHMIQNIVMVGEETPFWNETTDVLYITFIQLVNIADRRIGDVRQEIDEQMRTEFGGKTVDGKQPAWVLYCSLGDCDLVLVTANIPCEKLQGFLEKLALVRDDKLTVVRDYFTIYCFHRDFPKLSEGRNGSFCGYEAALLTASHKKLPEQKGDSTLNNDLEDAVITMAENFLGNPGNGKIRAADYVAETMQSLLALSKSGFSEEFAVSVLLSFAAFLKITLKSRHYEKDPRVLRDVDIMTRSYFNALNTLVSGIMHNGRQFFGVPAFHASYFDVPPKLATFYSAMAYKIVEAVKTEEDSFYRFIISPDYREDINVLPLEINAEENFKEHLAIIYLREEYFYDPSDAVKLLCHEIGHYAGNRCREQRVEYMFRAISFYLLSVCFLEFYRDDEESLVMERLAETLAEVMVECIDSQGRKCTRGIKFHLKDVSEFLKDSDYGFFLFEDGSCREEILLRWRSVLVEAAGQSSDIQKELAGWMRAAEVPFWEGDGCETADEREAMYDVLVRQLTFAVRDTQMKWGSEDYIGLSISYRGYCETVLQAFSESFADLQMKELMGERFDPREYKRLLEKIGKKENVETVLRQAAVLGEIPNGDRNMRYTARQITEYLKQCGEKPASSELVVKALEIFQEGTAQEQFDFIYENIREYRNILTEYCKMPLEMD